MERNQAGKTAKQAEMNDRLDRIKQRWTDVTPGKSNFPTLRSGVLQCPTDSVAITSLT